MIGCAAVVCAGSVLGGLWLRARLRGLWHAEPSTRPVDPEHRFILAAGVKLDSASRSAASAMATCQGMTVLDLVPENLPVSRLMDFAWSVDTSTYRERSLAPGRSCGQAIVAHTDVLQRAGIGVEDGRDLVDLRPADLADLAGRLKKPAIGAAGFAVVPGLRAGSWSPVDRLAMLGLTRRVAQLLSPPVAYGLLGICLTGSLWWGMAAVAVYCAQPAVTCAGRRPRPNLVWSCMARPVLSPYRWLRSLSACRALSGPTDPHADLRDEYTAELAQGTDRFVLPRQPACPWCGSSRLRTLFTTIDYYQRKPGRFTLQECRDCTHTFQNPRLSSAGLDFYYRDFYDGVWQQKLDTLMSMQTTEYAARARLALPYLTPKRWLDVGTGHGHFPLIAREIFPNTVFDGLDIGDGVESAERYGWIDRGYRGMFPDLAEKLTGRYDVISMNHYLEHTTDPRAELAAAAAVLPPGGHLLIELPNPQSRIARLLRGRGTPWFQPQHLHMIPMANLQQELTRLGFTTIAAQQPISRLTGDFTGAYLTTVLNWPQNPKVPWVPHPPTPARHAMRAAVLTAKLPIGVLAVIMDLITAVLPRGRHGGPAYRLLARKGVPATNS